MSQSESLDAIPSRLETHASGGVPPPVPTALGILPFAELRWEDLERLCLRLARTRGDVTECRLFGVRGDQQEGIDLYSRREAGAKWSVYQCKKVKTLSAQVLDTAVSLFLAGDFANETEVFTFCTNQSLRSAALDKAWRRGADVLKARGIEVIRWDSEELTELLRNERQLVFDFFGSAWFKLFFGEEPVAFTKRLTPNEVAEFTRRCRDFYAARTERLDSGAVLARRTEWTRASLPERFVPPDVFLPAVESGLRPVIENDLASLPIDRRTSSSARERPLHVRGRNREQSVSTRIPAERWLGRQPRQLLLGAPGIGKSTLLRVIAVDLLSEMPRFADLARRWGLLLPVWVPFPYWTAQVSAHHGATSTLPEMLREWFEREHQAELWPLIKRALDDDRLLLLVDGVDEYSDEKSAGVVLQQLLSFLDARGVPALLASRPHGFEALQSGVRTWSRGMLAPLSRSQQEAFARVLFRADANAQNLPPDEADVEADRKANDFTREVGSAPGLSELAGVPLLLGSFVRLALEGKRLPEDRFDACVRLVDLLLEEHPQRRREAAHRVQSASGATLRGAQLGRREIRLAFAALAFALQEHAPGGNAGRGDAVSWLAEFLHAARWNVCLTDGEAHKVARALLEEAQSELGLLVEPAQGHVGFLHRSCQEWLAAEWIRELTPEEQRKIVCAHALKPQWREVLLGAFRLLPSETLAAVADDLQTAMSDALLSGQEDLQTLLTDLGFQANSLAGAQRSELIHKSFEWIERGRFTHMRERLLSSALSALRGGVTQARHLVRARMDRWLPSRGAWRAGTLEEMGSWPRSPLLVEVLMTNLHDPEHHNTKAAAGALAKVAGGDPAVCGELIALAHDAVSVATSAAAIEALRLGWSAEPRVLELARQMRGSGAPEVALAAIRCLIAIGEQSKDDRERMLRAGKWAAGAEVDRAWRTDLVAAVIQGWPGDATVLESMTRAVQDPLRRDGEFESPLAFAVLFGGFAGSNAAADAIARYLAHEHFYFNRDGDYPSRMALVRAAKAWQGHAGLTATFEEWFEKNGTFRGYAVLEFYHAAKTARMKERLMARLRDGKSFFGLELHVLIRVWGLEDPEVNAVTRAYVRTAPLGYAEAQELLLDFVEDRASVRAKLLAGLVPESGIALVNLLDSVRKLDGDLAAPDVVEACLRLRDKHDDAWPDWVKPRLIAYGARHPEVRALAFGALEERDGPLTAVATAAANDPELEAAVIPLATPLPRELRQLIARTLTNFPAEEKWVDELLAGYDRERESAPKVELAIACARRLRRQHHLSEEMVADFRDRLRSTGSFHEQRRLAGLAGLIASHRAEWLPIATLPDIDVKDLMESGALALYDAPNFVGLLEEEWDPFLGSLDDNARRPLARFLERSNADFYIPNQAPAGSRLAKWLITERQRGDSDRTSESTRLAMLACAYPQSEMLKKAVLDFIHRVGAPESRHDWHERAKAARLLGTHFAGNESVLAALTMAPVEEWTEATAIALAHGWANSTQLEKWFEHAKQKELRIQWEAFWPVAFAVGRNVGLADRWADLDAPAAHDFARAFRDAADVLVQRTAWDEEAAKWIFEEIAYPRSATRSTTALSILLRSGISFEGFQDWLRERERLLGARHAAPAFGYDFTTGEVTCDAQLIMMRSATGNPSVSV
ncbi:MAG TPA: NACHT domain-containing protein [Chthoniobacterales bacterium]|jgi:hypothetical protein|nr:NACHT domain-containing protein [Chthoniobacterales bacterium]